MFAASVTVTADADGLYTFQNLIPGRYYLRVEANAPAVTTYYPSTVDVAAAAAVDVEAGGDRSGVDIRQLVAPVFRIRGKAVDESGAPAANASLYISQEPPISNIFPIPPVPSVSDGSFEFGGLLPGRYTVHAEPEGSETKYAGRVSVAVEQRDIDDLRLVVNRGFSLSGFVGMDDGTAIPAARQMTADNKTIDLPLFGIIDTERWSMFRDVSVVRAEGRFRIDNVPAGKYRVLMQPLPQKLYIKSIKLGNEEIHGPLDLSYGSLSNMRIVLGTDAGEVHAVARDRNGQAMAGVFVVLWPEPRNPDPAYRPFFGSLLETDENGTVLFDILPPGKYRLAAFTDVDRMLAQSLDFLEYFQSRAETVEVEKNGSVESTLEPISRDDAAAAIRNLP